MKHIKYFEELKYSTYLSYADKVNKKGQIDKSKKAITHAQENELKKISEYKFNLFIGNKVANNLTYSRFTHRRQSACDSFTFIFTEKENNCYVTCDLKDGKFIWSDNNKFSDRKSINNLEKVIKILGKSNPEFSKILNNSNISLDKVSIDKRTFYT